MSDAPPIASALRRRIENDPWAKALGVEFLEVRRGRVALSVTINYLAAVAPDAALVAEARELKQGRRAGFYQLSVTTQDGRAVAVAQAIAHRVTARSMMRATTRFD